MCMLLNQYGFILFSKQKTAYEMRISDWSSDVCSSDLSNPTFRVTTGAASYVLRRKPPGPLLPGAHAIEREARVLASLATADFPVPHVHGLCDDAAVIGSPFYVIDIVEGRIFWDAALPSLAPMARAACCDAINAELLWLHRVHVDAGGLAGFGTNRRRNG